MRLYLLEAPEKATKDLTPGARNANNCFSHAQTGLSHAQFNIVSRLGRYTPWHLWGGGGGGDAVYLRPAIRKAGGGGGGAVRRFSPDTKSGEWGGCLAEEGEVPYMKGGVATPNPPLDPPLILVTMHAC